MEGDAGRSIIQTTIQRWKTSGSVVTCDPTGFLDIQHDADNQLLVSSTRSYPLGLGLGKNGFALDEGQRVCIPATSFAVWYYRQDAMPSTEGDDVDNSQLVDKLRQELGISPAEYEAVFIEDDLSIATNQAPLTDSDVFDVCSSFISSPGRPITQVQSQTFEQHASRIRSMKTVSDQPSWLRRSPEDTLRKTIASGASAVLLYGPPRTGKTRAIDAIASRGDTARETIQIHDGWGYDNLVEGFRPTVDGSWTWVDGPLKVAIEGKKHYVVLEEVNRTNFTQAVGEVFSLIEEAYRGAANAIRLRSGKSFFIPASTVFLMTMNTLDKSTEDIDDAMMGRFSAIEFPPRVEDLTTMLDTLRIERIAAENIRELFAFIQDFYPLGQGYFAALTPSTDFLTFYLGRIRPVLENHFRNYRPENLALIDNKVDALFGR
jgi:hypothetical protein